MSTQEKVKEPSLSTLLTMKSVGISIPEKPASREEISTWVRVLVHNWHQGTVGVKGRSDVAFSGKKPWKQKGTGRARAGTARSPLWRGGGVIFGPQAKDTTWRVNRNTRKRVLATIIADYIKNKKALLADWELKDTPSTAQAAALIKNLGLTNTKVILFLPSNDVIIATSFANVPNVHVLFMDQLNAYDLLIGARWIILKKDLTQFKEMVALWQ